MNDMLYLDHNATTPLDSVVLEAMLPFLTQQHANASATYSAGREARQAVERARAQVAAAVDADPSEVIFTASGSEANNLLIQGLARGLFAETAQRGQVACSAIEHPCVYAPLQALAGEGWGFAELPVTASGVVDQAALQDLPADTRLFSVMLANNETGVVQPVTELAQDYRARHADGYFHSDAVQALGKLPLSFRALQAAGVDAITVSSHKIGGPKGAAALIRDRRLPLLPLIYGGGQESGLRSGTENVAAIVGFGLACERAVSGLQARIAAAKACQTLLEDALRQRGAVIFGALGNDNGPVTLRQAQGERGTQTQGERGGQVSTKRNEPTQRGQGSHNLPERLPNTTYAAFPGIDGETLVALLDRQNIAVSSGAACGAGKGGVSKTLLAMGIDPALAKGALRISLGMMPHAATDIPAVEHFIAQLDTVLAQLRRFAAVA